MLELVKKGFKGNYKKITIWIYFKKMIEMEIINIWKL